MPHPSIIPKCPFYGRENQITIFCESNIRVREEGKRGYYAHLFKRKEAKKEYMRQHCQKYPDMNCPYANYMERFYERSGRAIVYDEGTCDRRLRDRGMMGRVSGFSEGKILDKERNEGEWD